MVISDNKVVSIEYTLKDKNGEILDSSDGEALAFIQGSGQIIPGLETALNGKKAGDKFSVTIEAKDAYGEYDETKKRDVPMAQLTEIENIQVGMQLEGEDEEGEGLIVTIVELNEETATLDANHPLAGSSLHFDINITDVREATAEELSHGHVHGPGGHVH